MINEFYTTFSLCFTFDSTLRPPGTPREIPGCFGGCDETVCSACYNSTEPLTLPKLSEGCPTTCPVDSNGVISSSCFHKWGKCVKKGCLKTYGKVNYRRIDTVIPEIFAILISCV